MVHITEGNLLKDSAEAIVNTVNCVGVMGKGIALQFKQAFPDNFKAYARACKNGDVKPGKMFVFSLDAMLNPKYIINFPTKNHWREKSKIGNIEAGLSDLANVIRHHNIKSIAIPPLGCGYGGLRWDEVRGLIETTFKDMPDVDVRLYAPKGAPDADSMLIKTEITEMTKARALFIKLLNQYAIPGYRLSLLEIQKLAYFLQEAGEPLQLNYVKQKYGPYAENLNFVLQRIEGHFISGYGDRSRKAFIQLLPGAVEQAEGFLANDSEARERLDRVAALIEGFETPYGMELLASVHWVCRKEEDCARHAEAASEKIFKWNTHKNKTFKANHIHKAWARLSEQKWLL
ncbi:MAG: macro domain-containing protein [Thermodesulfobacteriota bacterium]|nr:macro domain-containing protein [Thermodesulfobacteriota bacterium]